MKAFNIIAASLFTLTTAFNLGPYAVDINRRDAQPVELSASVAEALFEELEKRRGGGGGGGSSSSSSSSSSSGNSTSEEGIAGIVRPGITSVLGTIAGVALLVM